MENARHIREFICETLYVEEDDGLRDDESLLERGLLDSTGVIEVVAFLEERFGIVVEDSEIQPANLDSIDRMARFVERKTRAAA